MTEKWFTYRKTFNSMMWTGEVGMNRPQEPQRNYNKKTPLRFVPLGSLALF